MDCVGILFEGREIFHQLFQVEVIVLLLHANSSCQGQKGGRRGREGGRERERERGREKRSKRRKKRRERRRKKRRGKESHS